MGTVKHFREWLRGFPKEPPERMALALAAVDAYASIVRKARVTAEDLAPLVAAASSRHTLVFETGAKLLNDLSCLAGRQQVVEEAIRGMATSRDATARFHAVAYLEGEARREFLLEIVRLALADKSAKVRWKGVDVANRLDLKELIPDLKQLQKTERNTGVLETLASELPLLEQGWVVQPVKDSKDFSLWIKHRDGSTSGTVISKAQSQGPALKTAIAKLRRDSR